MVEVLCAGGQVVEHHSVQHRGGVVEGSGTTVAWDCQVVILVVDLQCMSANSAGAWSKELAMIVSECPDPVLHFHAGFQSLGYVEPVVTHETLWLASRGAHGVQRTQAGRSVA